MQEAQHEQQNTNYKVWIKINKIEKKNKEKNNKMKKLWTNKESKKKMKTNTNMQESKCKFKLQTKNQSGA
jgi:hypothetical protein